ncbi:MAG: exopolyphosphatase/guanosine-5'-triphosphate,3'-diphosphate pyrophosphatase [Arenicella sp.]|jgi:exopolyphosphatase/guanosine-5'-triphosphate,3'-diphosphate pyrophosphatase
MQPPALDDAALELGRDCYAAVDLGSNSFHLVISRYNHGEFTVIDRQREVVRLAAGLDENSHLSEEVASRALLCLTEFGQLLASLPTENIRAVGTNALRRLHGKSEFLERAEFALGHSIEIIAGREEARLIYLGVSKWSSSQDESRLVIDIGGGSTEIIAGKGDTAHCRESLEVGCVVLSSQFFADGNLSKRRFDKAILAAELAIQPVVSEFRMQGWSQAIGCSGTMKSMALAMVASDWSADTIRKDGLHHLLEKAIAAEHLDNLVVSGVSRDRMPVFAGGLAILIALFDLFDIQEMSVSDIALREGVLYDLVGRSSAEDIRDVTVSAMLSRWDVDAIHGDKVRSTASMLYQQVAVSWDIRDILFQSTLQWSAQLHEVGLQISHDRYHKHGAYVLANADMAGFAKRDQLLLAALISGHRRKFPLSVFESLPSTLVTPAKRVAVLLRIAVLLHRGRASVLDTAVRVNADGQCLSLVFDSLWLSAHPLTKADLKQESSWLKSIGIKLDFS